MNVFVVVALTMCFTCAFSAALNTEDPLRQRFEEFKAKYDRSYESAEVEEQRFQFFKHNVKKAALLQRNDMHARFGVTKFSDMDPSMKRGRVSFGSESASVLDSPPALRDQSRGIPNFFDWREKGAVVPPPNQGQCGDPCSFAVTGVIESMYFIAGHRPLTPLSSEQLTACVSGNEGCNGCEPTTDYNWILQDNHGHVATEASYPYNSSDGSVPPCKVNGLINGATITNWNKVSKNEAEMALWIATHGPLAIIIDATPWQTYTGGVLSGASCQCSDGPDHMALLVGYNDKDPKLPYWIIRNQWGTDWGEEGYIYIEKGVNCNDIITDSPSSVTPLK